MTKRLKKVSMASGLLVVSSLFSGCQSSMQSLGPLMNQTPSRVPPPATGSFQTPTSYTPQSPAVTSTPNNKLSAAPPVAVPPSGMSNSTVTPASPSVRTASTSLGDSFGAAASPNPVVPASFSSPSSPAKPIGTGLQPMPTSPEVMPSDEGTSASLSDSGIDDPRSLTPTPAVNVQWRSPSKQ